MVTKYPSGRKGRCNFDTALHYNTVDMIVTEKTRTAKPAVRATCSWSAQFSTLNTPSVNSTCIRHLSSPTLRLGRSYKCDHTAWL